MRTRRHLAWCNPRSISAGPDRMFVIILKAAVRASGCWIVASNFLQFSGATWAITNEVWGMTT